MYASDPSHNLVNTSNDSYSSSFSSVREDREMEFVTEAALLSLPVEVVVQIANELGPVSLRRLSGSCRSMNNVLAEHSEILENDLIRLVLNIDYASPDALPPSIMLQSTVLISSISLSEGMRTISDKNEKCGHVSSDGKIVLDFDLLQRMVAGTYRRLGSIDFYDFTIDAAILSDLKHLLIRFDDVSFHCCKISALPDFRTGILEYHNCDFPGDLHIPSTFSASSLSISDETDNPPPPRKYCNKMLMKFMAFEDSSGLGSNIFLVRQLNIMHMLRKRSPRMESLSFAIGDNLVYYAAGLTTNLTIFNCPNMFFGGPPLSSLGVRKFIKRVLSGPSESLDTIFYIHASNFYRQHLLEDSFEVVLRLPREKLLPGVDKNEKFIFEKDDDIDVIAETMLIDDVVTVFFCDTERSKYQSKNIIRRKSLVET